MKLVRGKEVPRVGLRHHLKIGLLSVREKSVLTRT